MPRQALHLHSGEYSFKISLFFIRSHAFPDDGEEIKKKNIPITPKSKIHQKIPP